MNKSSFFKFFCRFCLSNGGEGVASASGEHREVKAGGNVVGHGLLCEVGNMHLYGLDDSHMIVYDAGRPGVFTGAADELYHRGLIHRQVGQQHIVAFLDIAVAAGADDKAVEGHIRCDHAVIVLADNAFGKLVCQPVQLTDGGIICPLCAECGRLAFNGGADIVQVYHIAEIKVDDKEAAGIGLGYNEALVAQVDNGLCNGGAGYAQTGGYAVDVELCARSYTQGHDLVIQHLRNYVAELCTWAGVKINLKLGTIHSNSPFVFMKEQKIGKSSVID